MKKIRTWVVVADGEAAQVYQNDRPGSGLFPIAGGKFTRSGRREQDVYSDRQGRSFDSVGYGRHSMERPTSAKAQDLHAFSLKIADWLETAARAGRFDRLALIAAPKMLGELRNALTAEIKAALVAEVAKDLTKASPEAIEAALADSVCL